ncbi:molybdenum ABC transporter ATP-binding protein [Bowmanella dokdonensis]|uniref:Molybdenum ABC transporter ATP-binding protein n=1 Tax=Bowmanella dokdonensis TaxID=751969 RepID=A0A939DKF5_9ALTE|nr:molybdenum ABC transporter ATP-binding protein [Bowmanella dokdonensis]MBN7824374.1 molybdenum ABC transporter ATP-binding protein [Bowmanella dokdonensis]
MVPESNADQMRIHIRLDFAEDGFSLCLDTRLPLKGVTAIFGRSGSGKTSLLRCLAGLETRCQGSIYLGDQCWQAKGYRLPTHKRPLGYVFQEASLFEHLSVRGNLDYARKRAWQQVTDEEYHHILDLMGIEPLLQRRSYQLSGGERQRVAIARALLIKPSLLLMDEPLAALDQARKQEILPYLEQLKANALLPILYVSHALEEVSRLADTLLVLESGQLKAQGAAGALLASLDCPLPTGEEPGVLLEGSIVERDQQWNLVKIAFDGGELWLSQSESWHSGPMRVRILARDVSLTLAEHQDSSILNRLPGVVRALQKESDGAMILVRLSVGNTALLARISRRSAVHLGLCEGKSVWVQIKSAALVR